MSSQLRFASTKVRPAAIARESAALGRARAGAEAEAPPPPPPPPPAAAAPPLASVPARVRELRELQRELRQLALNDRALNALALYVGDAELLDE